MRRAALALMALTTAAHGQSADEIALAKDILNRAQAASFDTAREHCGTIGLDENGQFVVSRLRRGRADSCLPRDPRGAAQIIASFHTHGAFDYDADSEVPSPDDMIADMTEGVDGWIATPGGRLWFVDGQAGVARQICGLGCLSQDPDFVPGVMGPIPQRFTLDALERFFDE